MGPEACTDASCARRLTQAFTKWGSGLWQVLRLTADAYFADHVSRMAAALAYYTVFSIAPLLVIAVALAGMVVGPDSARGQIQSQVEGLLGATGASAITAMMHGAVGHHSRWASLLGLATLLVGASGVFGELQDSLNTIWHVQTRAGHTLWHTLRARFLSFAMILVIGFLLLVSLLISACVSAMGLWLDQRMPGISHLLMIGNLVVLWLIASVLFAFIFKLLPDVELRWSQVLLGSCLTAALFCLGRWAVGLYLGHSAIATAYGAVGSLAVVLIWVYVSAQVFLIGAELNRAMIARSGTRVALRSAAAWIPEADASAAKGHAPALARSESSTA